MHLEHTLVLQLCRRPFNKNKNHNWNEGSGSDPCMLALRGRGLSYEQGTREHNADCLRKVLRTQRVQYHCQEKRCSNHKAKRRRDPLDYTFKEEEA